MQISVGDKVRVNKDIPSINGMLHKGTVVKIDHITSKSVNNIRVTDNLGKIWFLGERDIENARE
tara:strand:+ start:318 stop:509 length:192 start_codon:yes stop_codon:yes gene_type:complete